MKITPGQRLKINENIAQLLVDLEIPYDPNVSQPSAEDQRAYMVANCVYWVADYVLEAASEHCRILQMNLERCHARTGDLQDQLRELLRISGKTAQELGISMGRRARRR